MINLIRGLIFFFGKFTDDAAISISAGIASYFLAKLAINFGFTAGDMSGIYNASSSFELLALYDRVKDRLEGLEKIENFPPFESVKFEGVSAYRVTIGIETLPYFGNLEELDFENLRGKETEINVLPDERSSYHIIQKLRVGGKIVSQCRLPKENYNTFLEAFNNIWM